MKKKEDKNKDLASLRQDLSDLKNLFVTGYEKIKVSQDFELRKVVRKAGGKYRVIKNNLAALAKALTAYAKTNRSFTFKAGIVEGRVIDVKAIHELAAMPSKEVIFAKLLYVISAPAQQLATVINAVGRNLAVVVDQGVKESKFSE